MSYANCPIISVYQLFGKSFLHVLSMLLWYIPGKAQSYDGASSSGTATPSNLVYSSDTVIVKVVKLTGIRIVIPSNKLVAGEEVSAHWPA